MNVLYITPDQWRGEALSALGHPTVATPHFDALAADGVLFANHFAQCAPCGPSRATLHTGMYLMNHRVVRNGTPLDARFTNIALEARAAGFEPALIGYTDTAVDPRSVAPDDPNLKRGWEGVLPGFVPLVLLPTEPAEWLRHLAAKGYDVPARPFEMYRPENGHADVGGFGPFDAPARYRAEDSDTAFAADRAIDYIAQRDGRPWFLHLVFLKPHPPYIAPAPYNRMYHPDDVPPFRRAPSPADEARQHPYLAYRLGGHRSVAHLGEDQQRRLRATYFGLITEVDDQVGRIVAFLKDNGLYDDTLIVVTSDHGDTLGDHWLVGKETYFDSAYRVPLIVRAPGGGYDAARGRVVDAFTEHVDVMPTLLELMGRTPPSQCDGVSLAPFLAGETPAPWRDAVHWEFDFREADDDVAESALGLGFETCNFAVIRDGRSKYVHFAGLAPLFFDLADDPDELHDRACDPTAAPSLLTCAQKMLSWRMAHGERTLTGVKVTAEGIIERPRR